MTVRVQVVSGAELDDTLISAWDHLIASDVRYQSPYLSPWFAKAVADVRDDVFVAVLEDQNGPRGFYPFQRNGTHATPVGGRLNDCQAVVVDPELAWSPKDLMQGSGLKLWDFDHMRGDQPQMQPFARVTDESPIIDLSDGLDAYLADRKASGGKRVNRTQSKWRKLVREHGGDSGEDVRFELLSNDRKALAQVIEWKLEQCRRTGTHPYFEERWTVDLVERLLDQDAPGCSGALSVLWVGDEIAAAHFGMTSRDVWHWWFPTYSHAWSNYSPGALLLLKLCEDVGTDAHSQSVVDLGKGEDAYKSSFANGAYPLIEGHVSRGSLYASARTFNRAARSWARQAPLLEPVRAMRRKLKA